MYEKVSPMHPDKVADRIAGALVDYAYNNQPNPKIAVEVLIGHEHCNIIAETSVEIPQTFAEDAAIRIAKYPDLKVHLRQIPQDPHLASNQEGAIRCGDNGIFKGVPVTAEQNELTRIVKKLYKAYPYDSKFILDGQKLIACQSNVKTDEVKEFLKEEGFDRAIVNPLGEWTGGIDVDSGATNRKLGSDMGDSVTGGGLMGKDLSKADVSVNIYCWLMAQKFQMPYEVCCAIGDTAVNGIPYEDIVQMAKNFIRHIGGFERFAEWGLIR